MSRRPIRAGLLSFSLLACAPALANDPSSLAMSAFLERQARLLALGDSTTSTKALTDTIFVARFEDDDRNCSLDSDADTLPDCAETGTGVFVDVSDTGTDAQHADTDGDGLRDGDEVMGTLDGLDLPALGANPLRKDLLVEYDWFEDSNECAAHTHAPSAEVLAGVAAVYAQAQVQNPDGSTGIHLIQDAGQGGVFSGGNRITGYEANLPGGFDATWLEMKSANFSPKRAGYFHYMLMAHRYDANSNSSGYGEVVGDDAMTTLACQQTTNNAVRTVLHELGHNLGLHHGGFEVCNSKPNYNSLMNYRYQFSGLDASCDSWGDGQINGYSAGNRVVINEASVDEFKGVCGNPPIDWNVNGSVESSIAFDLNPANAAECGATLSEFRDFDDWANITLLGLRDASGQLKSIKEEVACGGAPTP